MAEWLHKNIWSSVVKFYNKFVIKIIFESKTCEIIRQKLYCCVGRFNFHLSLALTNLVSLVVHGFGGLGVACWPVVPKFVGSNLAEAVGFLGRKNPQHVFLRRGSKAVGPMS